MTPEQEQLIEEIQPLIKRARVKDGILSLEDVSEFIEARDLPLEPVLEALEDENIEVAESVGGGMDKPRLNKTSLQIYLQEISHLDLLDPEEEIHLSKKIHESRDKIKELCEDYGVDDEHFETILKSSNKDLIHEILKDQGITKNELSGFMQRLNRYKETYKAAHSEMVQANLRLVITIAKKYQNCGLSFDDLINEGNLGLMRAVDRYDYRKGFRFSTYAAWWIRQSVIRAISNKGRTIRLPVYMIDLVRKWDDKRQELQQELGREPHMMEVADELNIDYEKATHIMRHSQAPTSLESPVGDQADAELKNLIESDSAENAEHWLDERMMKQKLWTAIEEELTEKEKTVFLHRYGLKGKEELTLEDVGEKLDLTRERIRQVQQKALEKIRNSEYSRDLRFFLDSLTT